MPWFNWKRRAPTIYVATAPHVDAEKSDYLLPNTYQEINRLDFQHYMLKSIVRANYLAPIASPLSILDVGCGTGRWCIEMARQFPEAAVTGLDISPPVITSEVPANCVLGYGNVLLGLDQIGSRSIAFTHSRLLIAAIKREDWPRVIAEYARVTRPGGWIEVVEGSFPQGTPAMNRISQWSHEMGMQRGVDMRIGPELVKLFRQPILLADERVHLAGT